MVHSLSPLLLKALASPSSGLADGPGSFPTGDGPISWHLPPLLEMTVVAFWRGNQLCSYHFPSCRGNQNQKAAWRGTIVLSWSWCPSYSAAMTTPCDQSQEWTFFPAGSSEESPRPTWMPGILSPPPNTWIHVCWASCWCIKQAGVYLVSPATGLRQHTGQMHSSAEQTWLLEVCALQYWFLTQYTP